MTPDPERVRRQDVRLVHSHPDNAGVPFSDYLAGGWLLEIQCWRCKRVVYASAEALVRRHGPAGSAGSIHRGLRCAAAGCGAGLPAMRAVRPIDP